MLLCNLLILFQNKMDYLKYSEGLPLFHHEIDHQVLLEFLHTTPKRLKVPDRLLAVKCMTT